MSNRARNTTETTPGTTGTTVPTKHNVRDAALHGASSAFSKPPVKPKPLVNTYTGGHNGALLAATKVGTGTTRSTAQDSLSPIGRQWTGGSSTARPSPSPSRLPSKSSSSSTLDVPGEFASDRGTSPSNIAAKLAAARYSPLKPATQGTVVTERTIDESDVLPPAGSARNALARLESQTSSQHPPTGRGHVGDSHIRRLVDAEESTESNPIQPTTSLVRLFEKNQQATPLKQSAVPLTISSSGPPPVKSPKPQRRINLPPEPKDDAPLERTRTRTPPPVRPKPRTLSMDLDGLDDGKHFDKLRKDTFGMPPVEQRKAQQSLALNTTFPLSTPPPPKESRELRSLYEDMRSSSPRRRFSNPNSIDSNDNISSPSSFVSAPEEQEREKVKPALPPPRRSTKARTGVTKDETRPKSSPMPPKSRSNDNTLSPMQIPEKFAPPSRQSAAVFSSSPSSDTIYHSNYQRESVKQITKHLTGESLSSAIVGAALASSRGASPAAPTSVAPQLPIRRQHHHHLPLHHNRSPSPPKPTGKLRTTLRKEPSSSSTEDEGEKYKKKGTRIMGMRKKHPNKHHEGTRKRWRDTITERERKRYEGVWAANKGLYIARPTPSPSPSPSPNSDDPSLEVLNLVVREIWARSRLPDHVLEEVWDLVDGRGVGRLRREEFVVGMWLIDQRLKGRKLPVRVSESVWGSVTGMGVKIRIRAHK